MLAGQPLLAALITVNGFDSTVADDGVCTLREAINAANSDGAAGGCVGGSGPDTIQLMGGVTLTLADNTTDGANGLPSVTSDITLDGAGHTITRSGANTFRFFQVATAGDLTLEDVTLTNGLASDVYAARGGAIFNRGSLALSHAIISACKAYAEDERHLDDREYSASARGGAIYNEGGGMIDITASTLSGNSAEAVHTHYDGDAEGMGGAIYTDGAGDYDSVTISSSTISGNSATAMATGQGAGYSSDSVAEAYGGGLCQRSNQTTVTLTNTTVSGNSTQATATADGDARAYSRGGGVWASAGINSIDTLRLVSSTLKGNTSIAEAVGGDSDQAWGEGSNLRTATGTQVSNTLIADGDCDGWFSSFTLSLTRNTDDTCAVDTLNEHLAAALADNGGPTLTHALLAGSNAIDHAAACGLANDQRGALRPAGACDAGAYEYGGLFAVDLAITKDDGTTAAAPGQSLVYTLVATNNGPNDVSGATVSDTFPAALTALDLTAIVTTGGATSSQSTGTFAGTLSDTVNLPNGSAVTYTVKATVSGGASGTIVNTATVTAPAGYSDTATSNNSATDTDTVITDLDFGDAPAPFPTLLASSGARSWVLPGFQLGAAIDPEADGQPTSGADGDDIDAGGDDEDGVVFTSRLRLNVISTTTTVDVTASAAGVLNAWVDFNQDGDWADVGEQIFVDRALVAGVNALSFTVPCGYLDLCDTKLGNTYARFRLTSSGGASYTGLAGVGEVEDYGVQVTPDDVLDLFNMTLDDTYTFYACDTILCGGDFASTPDVSLLDPADVLLHAGDRLVLKNGLLVDDGAALSILLGPVTGCP